jgi:predicted transcriptional regulator
MEIKFRKRLKDMDIEVTGNENEDVLKKFTDVLSALYASTSVQVPVQEISVERLPASPSSLGTKTFESDLENLVRRDDDGPKLLSTFLSSLGAGQVQIQKKAFIVISYLLSRAPYSEKELSSNRIVSLMKASGVNTINIHNATVPLTQENYIVKVKGGKLFDITTKGETYAESIISEAKKSLQDGGIST